MLENRHFQAEDYRYSINGQEKVDEIAGEGNHTTAIYWEYNTRLSRRWQLDPVPQITLSDYACFGNNPIRVIDPMGNDGYVDKDGNYLGDDGSKESHETRVIDRKTYDEIVGTQKTITDKMRGELQTAGTKLQEYKGGIAISDVTWDKLEAKGGQQLVPFLQNDSKSTVYFKPEVGDDAYAVKPGQDVYSPIDGVAAPHIRPKEVFKVVTGVRVTVTDSDIDWTSGGYKQTGGQYLIGGWHNEDWLKKISANNIHHTHYGYVLIFFKVVLFEYDKPQEQDLGWIELFKKSGVIDTDKYKKKHTYYEEHTFYGK